jgi:hypothetical protein
MAEVDRLTGESEGPAGPLMWLTGRLVEQLALDGRPVPSAARTLLSFTHGLDPGAAAHHR